MSRKRGGRRNLTRQQEKLIFAIDAQRRRARRSGADIVRRRDPQVSKAMEFLSSGKSSDPRIQAIKDKLRGEAKRGFIFNPGKSDPKYTTIPGQRETRLGRGGRMFERDLKIRIAPDLSEQMEPEFKDTWVPSPKQKGMLAGRAQAFLQRIRKQQLAGRLQKDADKKLGRLARIQDKKLLDDATGYKFHEFEEKPTLSRTIELYGSKGYHLVPRLELHSQSDTVKLDPHRVVYPSGSKRQFGQEANRLFPRFKKRIVAEKDLDGNKIKRFTGEFIHQQRVDRIPSPAGKQLHVPFLSKEREHRLKVVKSEKGGYEFKPIQLKHTVTQDTNIHSPFRRVSPGRTRNFDDETIRLRKEGGAFIVDEATGQRLLAPKFKKKEKTSILETKPWGTWQPSNFWDRMKWDSQHTTDVERYDLYKRTVKTQEENPLRSMLQEAEYQTWLKKQNQKPIDLASRKKEIVKSIRKSTNEQLRHGIQQQSTKIRRINQEKAQIDHKLGTVIARANKKSANLTFSQRFKRRIKRVFT